MKRWLCCCAMAAVAVAHAEELPPDNPVAAFYSDDAGDPAWTGLIAWWNACTVASGMREELEVMGVEPSSIRAA